MKLASIHASLFAIVLALAASGCAMMTAPTSRSAEAGSDKAVHGPVPSLFRSADVTGTGFWKGVGPGRGSGARGLEW